MTYASTSQLPSPAPFDFPRALRALAALNQDPDETSHVFTIIESLSGSARPYLVSLFRQTEEGRGLLSTRPDIVKVLADRDTLRAMPEGSLAHAYLRFVESEGITADGLVAASDASAARMHEAGSELEFASNRMRDTHDLWHTLTGFKGDILGEAALLAFTAPQTRNPGIAVIALLGFSRVRQPKAWKLMVHGLRTGLRAHPLAAIAWEDLLPLPVEEVRARLGVVCAPTYAPLRSEQLRAEGVLPPRPVMATA